MRKGSQVFTLFHVIFLMIVFYFLSFICIENFVFAAQDEKTFDMTTEQFRIKFNQTMKMFLEAGAKAGGNETALKDAETLCLINNFRFIESEGEKGFGHHFKGVKSKITLTGIEANETGKVKLLLLISENVKDSEVNFNMAICSVMMKSIEPNLDTKMVFEQLIKEINISPEHKASFTGNNLKCNLTFANGSSIFGILPI